MRAMLILATLAGCLATGPDVDCGLAADECDAVVSAALDVLPVGAETLLVGPGRGRGPGSHLEVHACYPDGAYEIADVFTDEFGPPSSSLRRDSRSDDPPCR